MREKITRRKFLEVSALGAAALLAGCSPAGNYARNETTGEPETAGTSGLGRFDEAIRSGGPGKDGIPPVDEPRFVDAGDMDHLLQPEDVVFVLEHGGETKVYPQKVLVWHEIVNDRVAGEQLSVTYCPLTGSTVAFAGAAPGGDPLTFGTTGSLVNSNLLMYDRQTDSEWPQILGAAINGPLRGASLTEIPLVWTTWERWKEHGRRDAPVLSDETGHLRSYGSDPYGSYSDPDMGYYESNSTLFPLLDESDRRPPKEVVVGVKSGDARHAILKSAALERGVWNLELDGRPIVAVADPDLQTVEVFDREPDGGTPEFRPGEAGAVQDGNGRTWRRSGPALEGPDGTRLPAADFYDVMWFAWYAFFPETDLSA